MGHDLVSLYYTFATKDYVSFDNRTVDEVEPRKTRCLEIFSPSNFSIVTKGDEFGQMKFWQTMNIQD
jgi:hypothetical protein